MSPPREIQGSSRRLSKLDGLAIASWFEGSKARSQYGSNVRYLYALAAFAILCVIGALFSRDPLASTPLGFLLIWTISGVMTAVATWVIHHGKRRPEMTISERFRETAQGRELRERTQRADRRGKIVVLAIICFGMPLLTGFTWLGVSAPPEALVVLWLMPMSVFCLYVMLAGTMELTATLEDEVPRGFWSDYAGLLVIFGGLVAAELGVFIVAAGGPSSVWTMLGSM